MIDYKDIMNNVTVKKNGCWLWNKGAQLDGYALISPNGKVTRAHRYFYKVFTANNIEGLQLHHKCRNKLCMNPDHLEPLTHLEHKKFHETRS